MEHNSDKFTIYLKKIVESYIENGEPIGSKTLKEKYNLNASPSTIRSVMAGLEKEGFLEKSHVSSGRIPSYKAFEYYAKHLAHPEDTDLESRLQDLFAKRRISIDKTLEEAAKLISEIAGITLITSSSNSSERLRSINLTLIDNNMGVIILVTSSGKVENKTIFFSDQVEREDVRIAVRIFKERLVNVALDEIQKIVEILVPILAKEIKNLDNILNTFMQNVFNFKKEVETKIYNKSNLILSRDISRERLTEILDLIEKKSIWEAIEGKISEEENLKIQIQSDQTAFISKKIEGSEGTKEISIIGSAKRMDYSLALAGLQILEKFLKEEKE
ncbi:heat-inducible transcriptional repressor HrcA [Mycoplasma procyoni]|uniref:heat-inducible transcriptional repressor HrcA n=1 Tax=Mycoplasma procyoni TaxID=568784 RepID=UPI00197BC091|nr:heat-inducible transcriptional repressor HrcA [Mycoplasma procyoni]MBN3534931.1 heat-inducible transcriptional repressor HrcA [Mycoplasma procyoni]